MHLWAQVSKWWQSRRIEKNQMQEWQACVSFEVNFDFCSGGDEIADWRNGRMRNCRSQVHSLRCLSMKAEHHCHPMRCIIYFVHLTNPTTLGQSTTCRKANWKGMIFYFTRREHLSISHHDHQCYQHALWKRLLTVMRTLISLWCSPSSALTVSLSTMKMFNCWFQKPQFPHSALIVNYRPIVQTWIHVT